VDIKTDQEKRATRLEDKVDAHHTRTEANHEEMMIKLDAHHERMKAGVNAQ
jgi:hypothetical protein